jgi:hypothetical protein
MPFLACAGLLMLLHMNLSGLRELAQWSGGALDHAWRLYWPISVQIAVRSIAVVKDLWFLHMLIKNGAALLSRAFRARPGPIQ